MKLYYAPVSTYSQKALIALYEKGLAFEPEIVELTSADARAAYEQVYPLGKVPFLKADDGWAVPESTIIIEFLDDRFPDTPRLIPAEREAARQVRFMDRMCDWHLNEPVVELLFQKAGFRPADETRAARANKQIAVSYTYLEQRLANQDWVCASGFSMADCALIPPLFYAQFSAPFNDRPNLVRYWDRARQRPSYLRVMAEFVPLWEAMMNRSRAGAAAA
jgi:glutathione S-transferase